MASYVPSTCVYSNRTEGCTSLCEMHSMANNVHSSAMKKVKKH